MAALHVHDVVTVILFWFYHGTMVSQLNMHYWWQVVCDMELWQALDCSALVYQLNRRIHTVFKCLRFSKCRYNNITTLVRNHLDFILLSSCCAMQDDIPGFILKKLLFIVNTCWNYIIYFSFFTLYPHQHTNVSWCLAFRSTSIILIEYLQTTNLKSF